MRVLVTTRELPSDDLDPAKLVVVDRVDSIREVEYASTLYYELTKIDKAEPVVRFYRAIKIEVLL